MYSLSLDNLFFQTVIKVDLGSWNSVVVKNNYLLLIVISPSTVNVTVSELQTEIA